MRRSTPIGLATGLVLIYAAIFMGEGWQTFFDPAALILVMGGMTASLLVAFSFDELRQIPPSIKAFFSFSEPELTSYIGSFTELSRIARREGLLALDRHIDETEDDLMRFGLELAVDGNDAGEADEMMRTWIGEEAGRCRLAARFFHDGWDGGSGVRDDRHTDRPDPDAAKPHQPLADRRRRGRRADHDLLRRAAG